MEKLRIMSKLFENFSLNSVASKKIERKQRKSYLKTPNLYGLLEE